MPYIGRKDCAVSIKRGTKVIVDADLLCFSPDPNAVRYEHGNGRPREVPEEAFHLESELRKAMSYDARGNLGVDMRKASGWLKRALGSITLEGVKVHSSLDADKPTGRSPRRSRWGRR